MLSGCYFHLTQSFVRKIGELGLKKLVSENLEVPLALKMIPPLAFEKNEQIKKSFELIVEEITNVADQQNLDSFVIDFLNASSGHKFPKKKYENLKGKVQNLMQIYREETDIHFFRAIASLT